MIDSSDEFKEHIAVAISGTPDYESQKLFGVRKPESNTGAKSSSEERQSLVYLR